MTNKFCPDCNKVTNFYWELAYCDKNPEGLCNPPMPHGNKIDGMITCEDDYCNPDFVQVDEEFITDEYVKTHEVDERCGECHQYLEAMT